jgi:transposase-like protein
MPRSQYLSRNTPSETITTVRCRPHRNSGCKVEAHRSRVLTTVTDVAQRNGVTRQTVHAWLRRYASHRIAGLVDKIPIAEQSLSLCS